MAAKKSEHIEHMELYAGLRTEIGNLATKLEEKHIQNTQRFDSTFTLILEKLKPLDDIKELREDVDRHTTQISFWRGSLAVLTFAITAILGFFGIHRHS